MELRIFNEEEIQKVVDAWMDEDWSTRYISLNRGHWEHIAPVIAKAQARLTHSQLVEWLEVHSIKTMPGLLAILKQDWQELKEVE